MELQNIKIGDTLTYFGWRYRNNGRKCEVMDISESGIITIRVRHGKTLILQARDHELAPYNTNRSRKIKKEHINDPETIHAIGDPVRYLWGNKWCYGHVECAFNSDGVNILIIRRLDRHKVKKYGRDVISWTNAK